MCNAIAHICLCSRRLLHAMRATCKPIYCGSSALPDSCIQLRAKAVLQSIDIKRRNEFAVIRTRTHRDNAFRAPFTVMHGSVSRGFCTLLFLAWSACFALHFPLYIPFIQLYARKQAPSSPPCQERTHERTLHACVHG